MKKEQASIENEDPSINKEEKIKNGQDALEKINQAKGKKFPPFLKKLRDAIDEDPLYNNKNTSEDEKAIRAFEILEALKLENSQNEELINSDNENEANAEKIARIKNQQELLAYLESIDGIKSASSDLFFNKIYLKKAVEEILDLGVGILLIKLPRTDGFREKVREIMTLEDEKRIDNKEIIANIKTREDMFAFLESIDGIKGSNNDIFFDSEYLTKTTKEILDSGEEFLLNRIPRTDGFRDKVEEIMLLEKIKSV